MAIFLSVLKIIGIVLLVLLAVVVLLLLLVLFVPVRYKVDATVPRTNLDDGFDVNTITAKASFSWLLHILSGGINFPKDKQFTVRVFGIKVFPGKKKNDDKGKKAKEKPEDINTNEQSGEETLEKPKEKSEEKPKEKSEEKPTSGVIEMSDMGEDKPGIISENSDGDLEKSEEAIEGDKTSADIKTEVEDENKTFIDVLWNIIDFVMKVIETPQNVFFKIQYTISRVCGKIDMIKTTLKMIFLRGHLSLLRRSFLR